MLEKNEDSPMKVCRKCGQNKPITDFCKNNAYIDKLNNKCRSCAKIDSHKWHKNNKERDKAYSKEYKNKNKEELNRKHKIWMNKNKEHCKEYRKEYYLKTRAVVLEALKTKRNTDKIYAKKLKERQRLTQARARKNNPERFRLKRREYYKNNKEKFMEYGRKKRSTLKGSLNNRMSCGIWHSLRGNKKGAKWESLAGYTADMLKTHIESKFKNGMNWERFMEGEIHIDHIVPISWWKYDSANDEEFKKCWDLSNLQPLWAKDNLSKRNFWAG